MADAATLKEEGNSKFKAGQFAAAVDAYTRSLEADPKQHLVLSNRSGAHLKLGDAEAALLDGQRCVDLAPEFPKGYSRQAAALQELKRWEDAVAICEKGMTVCNDAGLKTMMVEVKNRQFQATIKGTWSGAVSEELGGYEQEMEFLDGGRVRIDALGNSVVGTYWVDVSQTPHHLSIQVPMPHAPPGTPAPPPVPYIVKLDDVGLHLCCPFMVLERPTVFQGPGYCLMKKGSVGDSAEAEELSKKSEDERLLLCVKDLIDVMPNVKLEEPQQTDAEDVVREKLMLQVKFESKMFAVQKKFGQDIMKKVLDASKGDGVIPAALKSAAEMTTLRSKLTVCGLLEDDGAARSAPAETVEMDKPPSAGKAASSSTAPPPQKAPQDDQPPAAQDNTLAFVAIAAVAVAAIGAFVWQRSRK